MMSASGFFRPTFSKRNSLMEKYFLLHQETLVRDFFQKGHPLTGLFEKLSLEERYVLEVMIFLGEGEKLFSWPFEALSAFLPLKLLAKDLIAVEKFYEQIGGIVGYQEKVLELIAQGKERDSSFQFYKPEVIDIRQETQEVQKMAAFALEHLEEFAAIFPVGGVGDRLGLTDPVTKEALPTAMLPFLGKTLFELLLHDLSGLEYLYKKTFNKEIFLPVVVMTSQEKQNHERILSLCEERNWFGRPKESFCFIQQISVPVLTQKGEWVVPAPLQLTWKPGGHGMLWKLMKDEKVFDFLHSLGKSKAFVRQINNPVAGVDVGLLALMGAGLMEKKAFGFAACPRRVGAAEGVNVLREKKGKEGYEVGFANIEYSDFERWNIPDVAVEGTLYSKYPSNTNLLYVDLPEVFRAVEKNPFVGMMLNMKSKFLSMQKDGSEKEEMGGRLELMMQSIADAMTDHFPTPLKPQEQKKLKTFVLYNERKKTISATKRLYEKGQKLMETPEGCFFDLLHNAHDLLSKVCGMQLPSLPSEEEYLAKGPSFLAYLQPILGPLYSLIQKKILKGKLFSGAELQLEIADLFMENLELQGSLIIQADCKEKNSAPKCLLKNVKVFNEGIDFLSPNIFWQKKIFRKQALQILLHDHSEFIAENVCFEKDLKIEVAPNTRMTASMEWGKISLIQEAL
jgi:UTP---glucose-1-phosphate uridylyltransferase